MIAQCVDPLWAVWRVPCCHPLKPEGQLPVEVRAQEVNERLWRVFYRTTRANQMPIVTVATLNHRPILEIQDDQSTRPIRLVTVTEPDADWHGKELDELAQEWQKILQSEIARFKQLTAPDEIGQRVRQAFQILLGLILATGVIWMLRRWLQRRQHQLEMRYQAQLTAIAAAEKSQNTQAQTASELTEGEETEVREIADVRSRFLATITHQMTLKRQLDVNKFLKWLLFWLFILLWYFGIGRIMATVPVLMRWSLYVWATPLALIVIWFGISLAIRLSKSLIDCVLHSWPVNPLLPFVVIGLAISFGTQSLIKDLVNGCLILIEDQFAVGDVIQIAIKAA